MNEVFDLLSRAADDVDRPVRTDIAALVASGERSRVRRRNLRAGGGAVLAVAAVATGLLWGAQERPQGVEPARVVLPSAVAERYPGITVTPVTPVAQKVSTDRGAVLDDAEILQRCAPQVAAYERVHDVDLGEVVVLVPGTYREGDAVGLRRAGPDGLPLADPSGIETADVVCGLETPTRSVDQIVQPGPDDAAGLVQRCSVAATAAVTRSSPGLAQAGSPGVRVSVDPATSTAVRYTGIDGLAEVYLRNADGTEVSCNLVHSERRASWGRLFTGNGYSVDVRRNVTRTDERVVQVSATGLPERAAWFLWRSNGRWSATPVREGIALSTRSVPDTGPTAGGEEETVTVLDRDGRVLDFSLSPQ